MGAALPSGEPAPPDGALPDDLVVDPSTPFSAKSGHAIPAGRASDSSSTMARTIGIRLPRDNGFNEG